MPIITCRGISNRVKEGELLEIDLSTGEIENKTTGESFQGEGLSDFILRILENGGIKPMFKEIYKARFS